MKMRPFFLIILDKKDEEEGAGVLLSRNLNFRPTRESDWMDVPEKDRMEVSVSHLVGCWRNINDPQAEEGNRAYALIEYGKDLLCALSEIGDKWDYETMKRQKPWRVIQFEELVATWLKYHPETPEDEKEPLDA